MLINLTNHPLAQWENKQKQMAETLYGKIIDLPFPAVNPLASAEEVAGTAKTYFEKVLELLSSYSNHNKPNAVHIQGEFTFVYKLVALLKQAGIICVASTSNRDVTGTDNGKKTVIFGFVQFREY